MDCQVPSCKRLETPVFARGSMLRPEKEEPRTFRRILKRVPDKVSGARGSQPYGWREPDKGSREWA